MQTETARVTAVPDDMEAYILDMLSRLAKLATDAQCPALAARIRAAADDGQVWID